ncbi:hypothetical protein HN51_016402 [Arachis hypogaea]
MVTVMQKIKDIEDEVPYALSLMLPSFLPLYSQRNLVARLDSPSCFHFLAVAGYKIPTDLHIDLFIILGAKLAKLRRELLTPSSKGAGGAGEGFDVTKSGDLRVGLVVFPSVGKSTLLNKLTGTFSEVASYEFTTLTCIPGVITYR